MPPQIRAHEGFAKLADTELWYWDTGGSGPAIVLIHAANGSARSWGYQQPVFGTAGYRVIAYARRGYDESDSAPKDNPGTNSEDLHHLLEFLGVGKFHAVATAAGVQITLDYALSHGERLSSMVLACGVGGVSDLDFVNMKNQLKPPNLDTYPVSVRELGPSYLAANPDGALQWEEHSRRARTGDVSRKTVHQINWSKLEALNVPTLLVAGEADLSAPPSLVRKYAEHIANSEFVAVPEAGHSVFWERPDIFNRLVLDFIRRHPA
jgi:pimeloyl-ACP methyl ester carboxylesterase